MNIIETVRQLAAMLVIASLAIMASQAQAQVIIAGDHAQTMRNAFQTRTQPQAQTEPMYWAVRTVKPNMMESSRSEMVFEFYAMTREEMESRRPPDAGRRDETPAWYYASGSEVPSAAMALIRQECQNHPDHTWGTEHTIPVCVEFRELIRAYNKCFDVSEIDWQGPDKVNQKNKAICQRFNALYFPIADRYGV